jgi:uncharacterized protein (DUF608 family)
MNTSINISKIISRIQTKNGRASVTNHRFNELGSMIAGLDSFEFNGVVAEKKFNKLHMQLMNAGFAVNQVKTSEPIYETGWSFNIVYTRCK